MSLIDVIKYEGGVNELVWKYPSDEIGTWTQLIVNPSQEAILVKDGEICDIFQSGKYTLDTKNIPILNKIINLPFGGESPYKVEIWFINKRCNLDIKWGTPTPIQLEDPKYQIFIPVRSYGQFGIRIEDSREFFTKLIGYKIQMNRFEINNYFRGVYLTKIRDLISSYVVNKKISILEINAFIDELSVHIKNSLLTTFSEYGVDLINFQINDINVSEEDTGVKRLKEALAKRAEMNIIGYNYAQERSFDTLEGAAKNNGGMGSNIMESGIGLAMGIGLGNQFSNQISNQINGNLNSTDKNEMEGKKKICKKCGGELKEGAKFCHHCGEVQGKRCNKCGQILDEEAKFCQYCGERQIKVCNNCGKEIDDNSKFCSNCGTKVE